MKKALIIPLMFIGMMGWGQTDYLLIKFYRLSDGDRGIISTKHYIQ